MKGDEIGEEEGVIGEEEGVNGEVEVIREGICRGG